MRIVGSLLMALGVLLGIAVAAFVVVGGGFFGLSWFISVAVAKLTFLGALGLIGAGAVVHRIENRRDAKLLSADRPPDQGN